MPVSIRSGITSCTVPLNFLTPVILISSVPIPSIEAPIPTKHFIKSQTSGSFAALVIIVSPRAKVAAITRFSVAPTETVGNVIEAPDKPLGADNRI